ncbi:MAG: hypothetical protein LIO55_00930, partial [Oscillospiraceae bacterium]|nr:hypothetical protein [Oscillospiraceae bacterium]
MASSKYLKKFKYALSFLSDEHYIKLYYFLRLRRRCNLEKPVTYNEKLNWLKIHDRNPFYTTLVDKYEVKD